MLQSVLPKVTCTDIYPAKVLSVSFEIPCLYTGILCRWEKVMVSQENRRRWPIIMRYVKSESKWGEERMEFENLLEAARQGDLKAQEEIIKMYRPLLMKNSMERNVFDEDLYQELSITLLNCIMKFRI